MTDATAPTPEQRTHWLFALAYVTGWARGIKDANPDAAVGIPTGVDIHLAQLGEWLAQQGAKP